MGSSNPKQQNQQQIKQIDKIKIDVMCLKVKGYLELNRDRRINQALNKEKALNQQMRSPQRVRVDEYQKLSSLATDSNYIEACNIVIRCCDVLKENSLRLSQSHGDPQKIPDLMPFIETVLFASQHLNLQAVQEFRDLMLVYFGAALYDPSKFVGVDPELRNLYKNAIPDALEVNAFALRFAEKYGLSEEQLNQPGHMFSSQYLKPASGGFNNDVPPQQVGEPGGPGGAFNINIRIDPMNPNANYNYGGQQQQQQQFGGNPYGQTGNPYAPQVPQQQFPQQQGGFPQGAQGGFPQQQGGFPQQQVGFPQQQGGFPQQQGGFPQQQGGFPQQQGGFPQQQGGLPQQQSGGFPQQQSGGFPQQQSGGFSQQQGGLPQQPQGNFPQPGANHPYQTPGSFGQQPYGQQALPNNFSNLGNPLDDGTPPQQQQQVNMPKINATAQMKPIPPAQSQAAMYYPPPGSYPPPSAQMGGNQMGGNQIGGNQMDNNQMGGNYPGQPNQMAGGDDLDELEARLRRLEKGL